MGVIGAVKLMRSYTKGSSMAMSLLSLYIISLLPTVPIGVFLGTVFLCVLIVWAARLLDFGKSNYYAVALIVLGYALQDLSHMGTNEQTFQSTYSAGGHVSGSQMLPFLASCNNRLSIPFYSIDRSVQPHVLDA